LTLTVSFTPVFGNETKHYTPSVVSYLKDPPIYPIYWGPYWRNDPAAITEIDLKLDYVVEGLGGAYLRGIDQYTKGGGAGSYSSGSRYVDAFQPPASVSPNPPLGDAVTTEVSNLINSNRVPAPWQVYATPIYVVITDPSTSSPGRDSFNEPDGLGSSYHEVIWLSTQYGPDSSGLDDDLTTRSFSHELVEAMSDPYNVGGGTWVSPGPSFPSDSSAGSPGAQPADNEPNNNYVYRLGGPYGTLVQAFWLDYGFTKDYIVEDGNPVNMQIQPNPWSNAFSGGTLTIDTDQPANIDPKYLPHQYISLSIVQMPDNTTGLFPDAAPTTKAALQVVMDGQTFNFEVGQITAVELHAANDTESIDINGVPSGVPVTVKLGSGNYDIGIGGNQSPVTINNNSGGVASVAIDSIAAPVNVNGIGGQSTDVQIAPGSTVLSTVGAPVGVVGGGNTRIEVDDQDNTSNTKYTLDSLAGTRLRTSANNNFILAYNGVTTLAINGGNGSDTFNLSDWHPEFNLEQQVSITTSASKVFAGSETMTVLGPKNSTTWYLNRASSGYANFEGSNDLLSCDWTGNKRITIDGGSGSGGSTTPGGGSGGNTFYVQATGVPTYLNTGSGNDQVYVGDPIVGSTILNSYTLDLIQAPVWVLGQAGTNTLSVEDQGAPRSETYTLSATTVSRSGAGTITYSEIASLSLHCGNRGNSISVSGTQAGTSVDLYTGSGANTISVGGATKNLDGIHGPLKFHDQNTDKLMLNDQGGTGGHGYTLTSVFPWTSLARTGASLITFAETIAAIYLTGGAGTNTFTGAGLANWVIDGTNSGERASNLHFAAMQNLVANTSLNTFKFVGPGGNITGSLTGDGGTLDYSADGGLPIAVNLQKQKASRIGGTFSGISGVSGSTATTNTLTAADVWNDWSILQPNAGFLMGLTGFSFSGIEKLIGGAGVDVFHVSPTGTVLSINGGGAPTGQGDWLDYSAFLTPVTVNLPSGSATNVNNGAVQSVTGIQDVHGGWSGALTGNGRGNILIGGGGLTTIVGGTARSLLIGAGQSKITSGSSGSATGGDILIGGTTTYDNVNNGNLTALMAILAEWQSSDSFNTRFSRINKGQIPGGYKLNYGTTVSGGNSTLIDPSNNPNLPAVDWFFAGPTDKTVGLKSLDHLNNT
jgi:hypothetical protein